MHMRLAWGSNAGRLAGTGKPNSSKHLDMFFPQVVVLSIILSSSA